MITYGVHSYLFTEQWSDETLAVLETVKELGVDMLEIAVGDDVHFTPALTRRKAESLGLELSVSPGGEWPLECDISSEDRAEQQQGLNWHKQQVNLAAELGSGVYCGALYGHPGVVKRRVPPADEFPRIARHLHELSEYAARQGVKIVLEPMSHFRTHLVNTPQQVMRLIALSEHENLYALLDTYHLVTEIRDYGQAVRTVGERLWGLHACENDRGAPGGGIVPWQSVFDALHDIRFEGAILLETYNSSLGDFAYRRGMFHDVCPDGRTFAQQGLTFLRQHLTNKR